MIILKLNQKVLIQRQDQDGWNIETVFEPVFVVGAHIVSMHFAGLTILTMTSGKSLEVREPPEKIISMLAEGAAK
ncbi:hypothetical protein [Klebsiella quasipneumoniae]|uniref:hypothetical protein n=1 Tax=Klebsiella quasipneumoniae TaxID=1463165 RepID=UPI0022468700|nr:hypothetical protein [Klebsiella quasipneumoniae]EKA8127187.1 hypothetical protein [Klebsiella pneumoniae]HCQ8665800.1 hypothetical protein [Klebsiella variicola]EKT9770305.1 hypothetical protein [Klebsiella pneumoniae]EKU5330967.1 hypothetical protein [Klebsiella pneumoniae]EKZ5356687.1 hypothetical protein [Klebsiella pneumoniae]